MAAAFGSGSGSGPGSSSEDEHPAPAAPAPAASSSTVTVTINTNQNQEGPQAQAHHGTLNTWLNITGTSGTSGTGPGVTPSAVEECALSSSHRQRKAGSSARVQLVAVKQILHHRLGRQSSARQSPQQAG